MAAGWDMAKREYVSPDAEAVEALFEANSHLNPNCRSNQGTTPLGYAAWHGDEDTILALIECDADLDAENLDGAAPVHMTIYTNQPWAAALLMKYGAGATHARLAPRPACSHLVASSCC